MKKWIGTFFWVTLVAIMFVLTGAQSAYAAVTIDNVSTAVMSGAATMTITHQTGIGTSDRLMLVGVSLNNDEYEEVTGVTYNGIPLTFVGEEHNSDDARVEIWSLVAPSLGTKDVEITFNRQVYRQAIAGVITFKGVDQTSPLGTFASEEADGTVASVNVPSATGELVFGIVAAETPSGLTVGAGQTEQWYVIAGSGRTEGAGCTEPGAATVPISWELYSSDHWAVAGVSIRPSSGVTSLSVAITSPTSDPNYSTDTGTITLGGVASGPKTLQEVTWNNDRGGSGVCAGTDSWSSGNIPLALGANVITVTVEDVVGSTASDVITVNYNPSDGEAPSVTITAPTSASTYTATTGLITLGGTASDNVGVAQVTWSNDAGGSGVCSGTDNWSSGSITLVAGVTVFTITARDAAGNTGIDTITVTYIPESPPPDPDPDPPPEPTPGKGDTEIYTGYDGASGVQPNVLILLDTSSSMTGYIPTEVDPTGYDSGTVYDMYQVDKDRWFTDMLYVYDLDGDDDQSLSNLTAANFPCPEVQSILQTKGFWSGHIVLYDTWTSGSWRGLQPTDVSFCIPSDWPSGTPYPPHTYPFSVRVGNYINFLYTGGGSTLRRKKEIAKEVLTNVVEATFGVRFGYMTYNENKEGGSLQFPVQDMTSGPTGTRQELIDIINATENHSGTPLAESQFEAHRYFKENSMSTGGAFFDVGSYSTEDTPIQHWCQKNYVIHVTDGAATEDTHPILQTEIGDVDGDGKEDWDDDEVDDVVDDIAEYMYTHDYSSLEGIQNVMTYTVGFTISFPALQDAADQGGGKFHYCEETRDLTNAFHQIIGEIIQKDTSYTAPVIPVNYMEKTSSKNEIYIALFRPSLGNFWPGNIKKFGIATEDDPVLGISKGDLVDMLGNPVLDPEDQILETAVSFWGPWAGGGDGNNVTKGGVGKILQNMDLKDRNVYTFVAGKDNRPLTHPSNGFTTTNNFYLPATRLGLQADDDFRREQLINYIQGYDVYDDDSDGATTDTRSWLLGGLIHSRPTVVSYDQDTTVIFVGANDGMLHAFWDGNPAVHQGGSELWAYIPPSLLPRLQYLSGDGQMPAFYVDGSPQVYLNDVNQDGRIAKIDGDQAILICGLRRGGRHYFALDVTDPLSPEIPLGWAHWGVWDGEESWRSTGMIGPDMSLEQEGKEDASFPYKEMGQSWSTPFIATINDGGTPRALAFIGAGYHKNQDQATPGPDSMGRGLYAVDVLTGEPVWSYTYSGGLHPDMTFCIPSTVAVVDTNESGLVDRLYVGDTGARLWRFDLSGSDPSSWTGKILFNADPSGTAHRKFFYPPDVSQEEGYEIVYIGSGNRAHPLETTVTNYLYAIKDRNPVSALTAADLVNVTDGKLMSGTEEEKQAIMASLESEDGWYIRLENTGEKCLAPALAFGGVIYYTTFEPDATAPADPCEGAAGLGTARLYALDYRTGNAVYNFDPSDPTIGKSDRSLAIGGSIASGVVIGLIKGFPIAKVGVDGTVVSVEAKHSSGLFSNYWRMMD